MSASTCGAEFLSERAEYTTREIRNIARIYEATHGTKRGRGILAERSGLSDRRLRALLFEGARAYADEFLAVQAAAMAGRRERAEALRAEFEALRMETEYAMDRTAMARGGMDAGFADRPVVADVRAGCGLDR